MNPFSVYVKAGVAAVAVLAIAAVLYIVYDKGRDDVTDEVRRINTEAGEAATDAVSAWRRCIDSNGVYDFASGDCRGSSQRGR